MTNARTEYLERRGLLKEVNLTEDEIAEAMRRVSGDCVCEQCGKKYYDHPYVSNSLDMEGHPYLKIICDGTIAKL